MRPNIAFDIDGIVADFSDAYLRWAEKTYGFTFKSTSSFNWSCDQDIPSKAFNQLIEDFIYYHSERIFPRLDGSSLVNYVWRKTLKPITFITARAPRNAGATDAWIRNWFPDIDFIAITVKSGTEKWKYLDGFDMFVEDRRRTVLDLAERGKIVVMPRRKYNTLVGHFDEIEEKMIGVFQPDWFAGVKGSIILVDDVREIATYGKFDNYLFKE